MIRRVVRAFRRGRVFKSALSVSTALVVIAVLTMVVVTLTIDPASVAQVIAISLLGAVLQAAFLGLVYEVWLRDAVEDATLEKLGTARDVREHGLVRLRSEIEVDWTTLLEEARNLTIISDHPEKIIGQVDDRIVRLAGSGRLNEVRFAITDAAWERTKQWREAYLARWRKEASQSNIFFVKLLEIAPMDIVATESHSVLLLRRVVSSVGIEEGKQIDFRVRSKDGVGSWLNRQREAVGAASPTEGHSPKALATTVVDVPQGEDAEEEPETIS